MKNIFGQTKSRLLGTVRHLLVLRDKPLATTAKGWKDWERLARKEQPIAYWIHEVGIHWIVRQLTRVSDAANDLRYYIRCRLFDRYHLINTRLTPGYHDADERMMHGMFNLLVDFVEVDKAWMHVVFDREERTKRKHPWWSLGWTRFKSFRDPEAGIDHLRWESTLDDPNLSQNEQSPTQAQTARELLVLYYWWKEIRPNRPDPMDASGWSDYCDESRRLSAEKNGGKAEFWDLIDHEDKTPEDQARSSEILNRCSQIEEEQIQEDQDMLIRLIKVRKAMWT
jgi:hypothetical protein